MNFSEKYNQMLLKYFQKDLRSEEKEKIFQSVRTDRFLTDAIEGFESQPDALNDVQNLKDRFYSDRKMHFKFSTKYLFIAGGILVIAIISFLILTNIYRQESSINVSKETLTNNIEPKNNDYIIQEKEIDNATPIAVEKQITGTTVITNQPKTIVVNNQKESISVEPIKSKTVSALPQNSNDTKIEKELDKKLITYSNFPIIYLVDLKTVDYSKVYKNRPVIPEDIGLESKYESSETKTVFTFDKASHYIPYKMFLESALQKYTEADYKGALRDFSTILKTFPDDLNAFFYGGLCMYNLEKSEKAIAYFDKVIEDPINSFYQEAKWYKALALIQHNEKERTGEMLMQIIDESGFYAEKAKSLLRSIK